MITMSCAICFIRGAIGSIPFWLSHHSLEDTGMITIFYQISFILQLTYSIASPKSGILLKKDDIPHFELCIY